MSDSHSNDLFTKEVLSRIRSIRAMEYEKVEESILTEELSILETFVNASQCKFTYEKQDHACDTVIELHSVLSKYRERDTIIQFYTLHASLVLPEWKEPLNGFERIVDVWMSAYSGLEISFHDQICECEFIDNPSTVEAFIRCYSTIKVDNDRPRKILEIFNLLLNNHAKDQSSLVNKVSNSSMAIKSLVPSYWKIKRHVLIVTDVQPLYCYPLMPIKKTKYDNWEEQFRPSDWGKTEENSEEDEKEPDSEEDEEDDEEEIEDNDEDDEQEPKTPKDDKEPEEAVQFARAAKRNDRDPHAVVLIKEEDRKEIVVEHIEKSDNTDVEGGNQEDLENSKLNNDDAVESKEESVCVEPSIVVEDDMKSDVAIEEGME